MVSKEAHVGQHAGSGEPTRGRVGGGGGGERGS